MSATPPRSPWLDWQSRQHRLLRKVVLVAVGAFAIGYAATALWMWFGASDRMVVTVPDLNELTLADARRVAERAELVLDPPDSLPHPEVAAGVVLTQSPLPGQEVAPGTAVQVIVSSGRVRHAVPQVAGLSRRQAEELLAATGIQATVEEVNDRLRAGLAIGTLPSAGSVVEIPARVRLQVSMGPPLVAVPDLLGRHESEANQLLADAGLTLGEVRRQLRMLDAEGMVVGQQPAAGDSVPAGADVHVDVATHRLELLPLEELR